MARKINHDFRRKFAPKTTMGRKVSFSQRHTSRTFKPNLQWVTVDLNGSPVRLLLSARQIRSLGKPGASKKILRALPRR